MTTRELAQRYHVAARAWEDHYKATGKWDPKLEKTMNKAHMAYLRAQNRDVQGDDDGEEEEGR